MRKFMIASVAILVLLFACASTGGGATGGAQGSQTVLVLESKDAKLSTQDQLVYNAEADCIAWWEKTTDEATWNLEVKEAGDYSVVASIACDPQFPGSTVGVTLNGQTLTFKVKDTGTWTTFLPVDLGKITLKPGTYPVLLKAITVPGRFVANLRTIKFTKQ